MYRFKSNSGGHIAFKTFMVLSVSKSFCQDLLTMLSSVYQASARAVSPAMLYLSLHPVLQPVIGRSNL